MVKTIINNITHNTITIGLIMGCLIYSTVSYANEKGHTSKNKAQQHHQQKRLKTNPVTEEGDAWTANIESDIYRAGTFQNVTIGYSASNGWDFSLSLVNAQILGPNKKFEGFSFFNIAKTFTINPDFSITVGSQNGVAMVNAQPQLWYDFSYLDNRYDVTPWLLIHGGAYIANAALTGTSRQVGFITETEITFIPHKLSLQLDYVSGHHSLSGATANMVLNITTQCQMYMGVSVPEQNSGNEFAGIIGFNLSNKYL